MKIFDIALWIILCALLMVSIINVQHIRSYPRVSLRYEALIGGQAAYKARQYSAGLDVSFWPTFWYEYKASFSAAFATITADCIAFSGDASLVWPAEYISGSAPGVTDAAGTAVSEALARQLWGGTDVAGLTVEIDDEPYKVRGVFKGEGELALLSFADEDTSFDWQAAELSGGPPHARRSDAESYAVSSGLGRPSYIIMGGPAGMAVFMTVLPFLFLAGYGLLLILLHIRRRYPRLTVPLLLSLFILFAVLIPFMLEAMPPWVIPTRWSDFSFWENLYQQGKNNLRTFFNLKPCLRDVELKIHLFKQACILLPSVFCSIIVCFRWHIWYTDAIRKKN